MGLNFLFFFATVSVCGGGEGKHGKAARVGKKKKKLREEKTLI